MDTFKLERHLVLTQSKSVQFRNRKLLRKFPVLVLI